MNSVGNLLAEGRTSTVFEYGAREVVKVPHADVPRHWARMEAAFTAAVAAHGLPAAAVRDVVTVDGRDAIVLERIDGESLWSRVEADASGVARVLAGVHREILHAGLPAGVEGMVGRNVRKLDKSIALTELERAAAQELLVNLPSGAALLHGDLHPANVLLSDRGPVVIDWFDASIGHPVADVVRTSLLLRWVEPAGPTHLPDAQPESLAELHDRYIDQMRAMLETDHDQLRDWEAVSAASRLAERAEQSDAQLVELWRSRSSRVATPLLAAVSGPS